MTSAKLINAEIDSAKERLRRRISFEENVTLVCPDIPDRLRKSVVLIANTRLLEQR